MQQTPKKRTSDGAGILLPAARLSLQNKVKSRLGSPGQASREEIPEMPIEFYDVKKREKVQIPESEVTKTTYERQGKDGKTQVRYAFKAVNEGTKLTKFASKDDWDALDAPVE
jgi:hypothetical protein